MNGKVVLVTGATGGIGKVTARAVAGMGATVVGVGRSDKRIDAALRAIRAETGSSRVEFLKADLSSLDQVRDLAAGFRAKYDRLDVLINNAGAIYMSRQTTIDGYERTLALNHLAPFLLTNLLLDLLQTSAPARVVTVSSAAHRGVRVAFDDVQHERHYSGFGVYSETKLMNVLFTYELARRLEGTSVTANALHPGFVRSGFFTNNWGMLGWAIIRAAGLFAISEERGAQTSIHLASSPGVEGVSGQYFVQQRAVPSSEASYDEADQHRLWAISAQLTGLDDTPFVETIHQPPQLVAG